uniref:Uncharacterized protein n=1 Tax=Streptomyces avermitilis TaxID=33903 RepID=A0A499W570_STRAX|nr:hypothetical protein SAVMC3_78550 [Streptomyces avermitilis]
MSGVLSTQNRRGRRLIQLYVGLALYGASSALLVESGLGLEPWNVLHQGLAELTGLTIGVVSIIVGAAVLLLWIPLRQRPGLGTVSNVFVVGIAMDGTLALLPGAHTLSVRIPCSRRASCSTEWRPASTSRPASDRVHATAS